MCEKSSALEKKNIWATLGQRFRSILDGQTFSKNYNGRG